MNLQTNKKTASSYTGSALKAGRWIEAKPIKRMEDKHMTKYFTNCETLEEVKATFHKLAKELHPDNAATGDAAKFREMYKEY